MDAAPNPIPSYVATLVRTAISFAAGFLVSKGWLTTEQSAEVVGAALVLVPVVWGLISHRNAHVDLQKAIAAPEGQAE